MRINNLFSRIKARVLRELKSNDRFMIESIIRRSILLGFQVEESNDELILEKEQQKLFLRKKTSDILVFEQIYINEEYGALINHMIINGKTIHTIIDCGANIGLTSCLLTVMFPQAKIYSLEPDDGNFHQLKKNCNNKGNIFPDKRGVWGQDAQLYLDRNFRDGKDWSIRTVEANIGFSQIEGVSISTLMKEHKLQTISLLKIDIEGAEKSIFQDTTDLSFLSKVECIAIEIHDELDMREKIYSILLNYGFILFNSGELTIGTKNN